MDRNQKFNPDLTQIAINIPCVVETKSAGRYVVFKWSYLDKFIEIGLKRKYQYVCPYTIINVKEKIDIHKLVH